MRLAAIWAAALVAVSGCVHRRPAAPPAPLAAPHYVLGDAYKSGRYWFYPAENYGLDSTGIASVQGPQTGLTAQTVQTGLTAQTVQTGLTAQTVQTGLTAKTVQTGLTADGELRDAGLLTASMQTIQLPAIVEVTNLENGRQVAVRVNDRGPASPGRIIAVSPRAAVLLAMPPEGVARVRVQIDGVASRRLVDQLGGGPKLRIATAPSAAITAQPLPSGGGPAGAAITIGGAAPETAGPPVPDRLPERVTATYADPGTLYLRCGLFGRFTYANQVAARLSGLGADVVRSREGRQTSYAVRAGPFATVAQADAALDEALRAGVVDARITVE